MTLAHSFHPCSQMCRYSCPWTTLPCTSLSLLTWGCPCVDWRFSTNHWPLQLLAFWSLPQQLFYTQLRLLPLPQHSLPFHFLCVAGWSTILFPLRPCILPSWLPPFSILACEKAAFLFLFTFKKCLHLHVFLFLMSLLFAFFIYFTPSLIWWAKIDSSLWCWFKNLSCCLSVTKTTQRKETR